MECGRKLRRKRRDGRAIVGAFALTALLGRWRRRSRNRLWLRSIERLERGVAAGLALVTAVLGLALAWKGVAAADEAWVTVALMGLGAAYWTLAGILAWQAFSGVPSEGYLSGKHGWAIAVRKGLARPLLFPMVPLLVAIRRLRRRALGRSAGAGLDPEEKIRHVLVQEQGDGLWALSDHAVHIGSDRVLHWRIPYSDIRSVALAPRGPWARAEVSLTVGRNAAGVHGTFTHPRALLIQKHLEQNKGHRSRRCRYSPSAYFSQNLRSNNAPEGPRGRQ